MSDQVRINGAAHSWNSTIFKLAGDRYTGITSITFGDKIEASLGYGMGRHHAPSRRAAGKYVPDVLKIKGFKSTIEQMRTQLALLSPDGRSYGVPEVDCALQFVEPGDLTMSIQARACRVVEDSASAEENPDPLMDEITLQPRYYVRNGKTLFDSTQGLP